MTTSIEERTAAGQIDPARATNVCANAAFAFSVVGAVGLSVILAIVALLQIKTRDEGRGLAIAALAISAGWTAVFAGLALFHVI